MNDSCDIIIPPLHLLKQHVLHLKGREHGFTEIPLDRELGVQNKPKGV